MTILFWGLALFASAFVIHFVLWKIRLPNRQIKAILQIFFTVLVVGILLLWSVPDTSIFCGIAPPTSFAEQIHISLFFISLTLAYMITYTALEADSPSLVIMTAINDAGPDGLDKKCFDKLMNDDILVKPRIRDLLLNKKVKMDGDRYVLTPKGVLFAQIFITYRKIMNVSHKGG
ncbi:MAG: hypothetical protein D8M57_00215 [Candidatus Scalindua sp. AMX11]|nr:MAG: hypothetical protein DWQ00_18770 [Candidatus Scalindua sp.]NOG84131.1 hypothetical protein [Planctomycetota bacterium]RZV98960.1 MAG: hypothetical protein EX341_00690 [Candidatus Scalindua sp. SCAELEC01]TDE66849.1 MAG: hypothetical protein D8M57_00215 [Candidatus Scalindua sp. AMX11]GJQ57648.1 MAG: hypothetical protein SCALA701_04490 [Candidatus Scalindua sp.]